MLSLIDGINNIPWPSLPGYAKYECHTPILNGAIELFGENHGWKAQPFVDTSDKREVNWKGDLSMNMPDGLQVFVEIELGHSKSNFQNLSKFELSSMLGSYDFFLLGVPGPKLNKEIYYPSDFVHFKKRANFFKLFIHAPCVIFEIEPPDSIDIPSHTGLSVDSGDFPPRMMTDWGKEFILDNNLQTTMNLVNDE